MATLAIVNPRRRRRRGRKARARRRRHHRAARIMRVHANPKRRRRRGSRKHLFKRRRRGGGSALSVRGVVGTVKPLVKAAFPAAIGAVSLDVVWAYLPLPAVVQQGYAQYVAKGAGAVALGMIAEKFLGRETGSKFALGAMTVVLYNLTRAVVAQFAPMIPLSGGSDFPSMGYYGTAPVVGEYNVNALPDYYGSNYSQTGNFAEYNVGEGDN